MKRIYIPFGDGSVVSYDGKNFTIYRQPVAIDANLRSRPESGADRACRERRGELVKALEDAWRKECLRQREKATRNIYSSRKITETA